MEKIKSIINRILFTRKLMKFSVVSEAPILSPRAAKQLLLSEAAAEDRESVSASSDGEVNASEPYTMHS